MGWIDLFRSLGESLLDVLRAEVATLQEDLSRSGRHLGVALGLLGAACMLLFWLLGLLITLVIAVLCIWLQFWAATLLVLLVFAAGAGLLIFLGLRRMRQVENPVTTVRRRVDDHLDWWQDRLLRDTQPVDVTPAAFRAAREEEEEDLP